MDFATLALIGSVALLGPALAAPKAWRVPVVVGELCAGMLVGKSGFGLVSPNDATLSFLAALGFALTMFVAGTQVPLRHDGLVKELVRGALSAAAVGVVALGFAIPIAHFFAPRALWVFAVVLASSSAALAMPIINQLRLNERHSMSLIAQIAIADTACIVALPLAADPTKAATAAAGTLTLLTAGAALFLVLRILERRGLWERLRDESREHRFALELRISIVVVAGFAAAAQLLGISYMLAGFVTGLAVAAVGEPRRLARQLFAVTEGFFSPIFFVWLGASLTVRSMVGEPRYLALAVALGVGSIVAHGAMRIAGQPLSYALLAAGQLGVPVAAATVGVANGVLNTDTASAIVFGALITIAAASLAGRHLESTPGPTSP